MGRDEGGFDVLPQDCLVGVFRFLQTEDLQSAAGTCKASWEASEDPLLLTRLDLSRTLHTNPEGLLCSLLAPPSRRAQHVEAIATSFCKHITGSFLQHFCMAPSVRLMELDLSRCVKLELRSLVSYLPSVSHSLTSLSLRHNDHLLHDDAIEQIIHALALPAPPAPSPKAAGTATDIAAQDFGIQGGQLAPVWRKTGLRSLDLGTNTRRAARSSPSVLTAITLALLAHTCPRLSTLSLTNQEWVTDEALEALLTSSHPPAPLTSLDLGLCSALTDRGLCVLAYACPHLRVLSLRSVWRVTSPAVATLLQRCPSLESLNLNGCSFVGPEAFLTPHASQAPAPSALLVGKPITVPSVFSFLRTLNLSSMQRLGDDDLITIARQTGYRLREVSVSKCDGVTDRGIVSLCLRCPGLTLLNVADCIHVTAHFVHMLAETHVDPLSIDANLPPTHSSRPAPLSSLTTLNARHAVGWTDETTHLLLSSHGCGATNLRTLYLGGCTGAPPGEALGTAYDNPFGGLTDRSVHRIAAVLQRGLECLDLQGCQSVTDAGLAILAHRCPRLRRLTLSGLDLLSDSSLQVIRKSLLCLTELNLNCCRGLTDRGVGVLSWEAAEVMGREVGGGAAPAPRGGVDPRVKQLIDTKVMELQFKLIRLDEGGAASEEDMRACVPWFQPSHFEAVVEERAINGVCGYPGCEANVPASRSEGRFILDPKRGKVTQVNHEQSMYCSDMCHFAARRFASALSGEGTVFRPAVQAYVHAHLAATSTAEGPATPMGVKSPAEILGLPTPKAAQKAPRKFKPKPPKVEGQGAGGAEKSENVAAGHASTAGQAGEVRPQAQPSEPVKKEVVKDEPLPQGPVQQRKEGQVEAVKSTADDKPKAAEGKPPLRPILKKGAATAAKSGASAGTKRVSIDKKATEKKESQGDERMPLKFAVKERDTPALPKPLEVGAVRTTMIEGFQPSTKLPKPPRTQRKPKKDTSDKVGNPEDASDTEDEEDEDEITESEEEEEGGDDSDTGVWEFGENVGDDEDGPSILEQDAFVQLWDAVSGLLTPVSIQYVRKVAAGEDVATALASLQVDPQPADFTISRRLTSLADLLGPYLKPAAKMLRLTVEPAELYDRIRGLLTTLDLSHSMASLPSSRYKAMALLFVDACFPPKPTDESSDEVLRTTVESLAALGLSAQEYASIRGDLSSSAGLADV